MLFGQSRSNSTFLWRLSCGSRPIIWWGMDGTALSGIMWNYQDDEILRRLHSFMQTCQRACRRMRRAKLFSHATSTTKTMQGDWWGVSRLHSFMQTCRHLALLAYSEAHTYNTLYQGSSVLRISWQSFIERNCTAYYIKVFMSPNSSMKAENQERVVVIVIHHECKSSLSRHRNGHRSCRKRASPMEF